jgi:hypothetical protein
VRAAYVYYRIDPHRAGDASACSDALLAAMAAHCARPPCRLSRCDDADTWMEIYEGIADWPAFADALDRETARLDAHRYAADGRHLECFRMTGKRA